MTDPTGGSAAREENSSRGLVARLGLFDATMIVMGGIIGSGIFINPYVVARQVHTPLLILGAWALGGLIALAGAFIYAELAARLPRVGGQYAYIREAYHPLLAFLYGWVLLLVIQTGGMAAVAVTFARYFLEVTRLPLPDGVVATLALVLLTVINCFGVRAGSTVQSILMLLKILAITGLVACGWLLLRPTAGEWHPLLDRPVSIDLLTAFGAALTPVLFSFGGWQTANFIAGEVREPRKNLPRGLILGVLGVIALYLAVNFVCVRALGPAGLAQTTTPASAVIRLALGERGAALLAMGIMISTLGFLSQSILTAPRVYFAMADDGLFFPSVAWVHPRTRVPVVAIALQGVFAIAITLLGRYEQILNYVVSMDFIFFGLSASCLFVFRRREREANRDSQSDSASGSRSAGYRVPGHPVTTALFVIASWLVVINTIYKYPGNTLVGMAVLLAGVPVYFVWRWRRTPGTGTP
jgi:APA family basic amino acid/polyamine antiporter